MSRYLSVQRELRTAPLRWLVTGAAGFIGSNLVEELLRLGQTVVGLDNLATGYLHNLDEAVEGAGAGARERFRFVEGDIRDPRSCREACEGANVVLHQAALGSVPRSINDPLATHDANVTGTLNMLVGARDAGVDTFVYASSSSVYGDHPGLPKVEGTLGTPLSPYAVSKRSCELYANTFHQHYGLPTIGLRYFNVFGRRQDPDGPYAAVIPKWVNQMLSGQRCVINGDGETSRDFCYVANVVQANLLAARAPREAGGGVYNVAFGSRTTLNELHHALRHGLSAIDEGLDIPEPRYADFRPGDVRHSLARTDLAAESLGYDPSYSVKEGLAEALTWYHRQAERASGGPVTP